MSALNPDHPMSQFAQENATKLIACMLWKLRKQCPNLAIEITQEDIAEVARVCNSNGQVGAVSVLGKVNAVVLQLVDAQTGKMLLADEKLNENSPNSKTMVRMLDARKRAHSVADRLLTLNDHANNDLIRDAAEILKLLVWEPAP